MQISPAFTIASGFTGVDSGDLLTEGVELEEGVALCDGIALGEGFTAEGKREIPLFQTNFFPNLIQVYLIFETVLVVFNLMHEVPAIDAELANGIKTRNKTLARIAKSGNLVRNMWRD